MIKSDVVVKDAKGHIFEQAQNIKVGDKVILNVYTTDYEFLFENKWFGCMTGIQKAQRKPLEVMEVWNYVKGTYGKSKSKKIYEVKFSDGTMILLPHELLLRQVAIGRE